MIKHFVVLDYESYWDREGCSLRNLSVPEYIFHPKFEVLMLAVWDLAKWPTPKILSPEEIPDFFKRYPADETAAIAHNMLFDGAISAWIYNWVPARLVDTLGMARSLRTYPRYSLGAVAKELFGADTKGDMVHKVAGMNTAAIKRAGLWPDMQTYALNDNRLAGQIYLKLAPEFPPEERKVMDLVLRAAITPVLHADVPLLEQHLLELRGQKAKLLNDCGYDKSALLSTAQFKTLLESLGVEIEYKLSAANNWVPAFSKSDPFMVNLLDYDQAPDDGLNYQVQTLAAARLSQKSTIEETRAERFVNIARLPWNNGGGDHHLLPVALRYGGAHTHRLSGEWKMNMQNLPRDKTRSKLRKALVAPPGFKLITADLAQIEARIVASLCGQEDLAEQFRNGEDVYANFASLVFKRPITKANNPHHRFIGKTAVLGLGYGCGEERFYQMVTVLARTAGISLEGLFSHSVATDTVDIYRNKYAKIRQSWRMLDNYLNNYINTTNENQHKRWGPLKFEAGRIELPNGMFLRYQLNDKRVYGAKLLENIVQALARIVVMQAAVRLADKGLRFVLQAHDELIFSVLDAFVEDAKLIIEKEMTTEPEWLPGLPLAVEIGTGKDYGSCK